MIDILDKLFLIQKPEFVEPQEGVNIFKKLELKGFSFYWNSGQKTSRSMNGIRDVQVFFLRFFFHVEYSPQV